jgi:hypothetical protein
MSELRKITFVLEEFALGTPAQQLLDRFLIGYAKEGEFHRLKECDITLAAKDIRDPKAIEARVRDFGLKLTDRTRESVGESDAVVVGWKDSGTMANDIALEGIVRFAKPGTRIFVQGILANDTNAAASIARNAKSQSVSLLSGTSVAGTFRLPQIDLPAGAPVRQALIVVQGSFPEAEFDGLEGLLPVLERRRGGERGIRDVQRLTGTAVWEAADKERWSRRLLGSAFSRSNTIQGDPDRDGRTQDIVGLRLVQNLAREPRAWLLEHNDGLRSAILVLNGAAKDINFAVELADDRIVSAQLYRPPPPAHEEFSLLAAAVEDYFITGRPPWPAARALHIVSTLEVCRRLIS